MGMLSGLGAGSWLALPLGHARGHAARPTRAGRDGVGVENIVNAKFNIYLIQVTTDMDGSSCSLTLIVLLSRPCGHYMRNADTASP